MLAWRGGRRRLVREQEARRKLEGVFNTAAKVSKRVSRSKKPVTIEEIEEQFTKFALRTKPTPEEIEDSNEDLHSDEPVSAAAEAAQASPQYFRAKPAFPSLGTTRTARTGVSLDILAIQGGPRLKTDIERFVEEEISSEKKWAFKKNSLKKDKASGSSSSKTKQEAETDKIDPQIKRNYQVYSNYAMMNESNDIEPMSLEL